MSEEEIKKKLNGQLFFLVGLDSCLSEDSSTGEYSERALKIDIARFSLPKNLKKNPNISSELHFSSKHIRPIPCILCIACVAGLSLA